MAFTERIRCNKKVYVTKETDGIYHTNSMDHFFYIFHLQVTHERPWEKLFYKYMYSLEFSDSFFFLDR